MRRRSKRRGGVLGAGRPCRDGHIPDGFLQANTNLTGTLRVGPAVQTIGARAFFGTKLTGLDLSEATSLVEIGDSAFLGTDLEGTLVIPAKLTKIGPSALSN